MESMELVNNLYMSNRHKKLTRRKRRNKSKCMQMMNS